MGSLDMSQCLRTKTESQSVSQAEIHTGGIRRGGNEDRLGQRDRSDNEVPGLDAGAGFMVVEYA